MTPSEFIVGPDDPVLVTGATGFVGPAVVRSLLAHGFKNVRAFARPSSDATRLDAVVRCRRDEARVEVIRGNLLSREDCMTAARDVAVIFHLAMGGRKSFPDAVMNSVVTTRNLLDASLRYARLRRFVNVSSLTVYSNTRKPRRRVLDESSPVEDHPGSRGDAYGFAKIKQDEIVREYGNTVGLPYVIVRPGYVYGPGKDDLPARVGIGTFGVFLHLGGSNRIPLTYLDNCADAIVLAGVTRGVDGEVFNVVDDDPPSSRQLLRLYKRHVRRFPSLYIPHAVSYALCWAWERYSRWSEGQLPAVLNRKRWHTDWKRTRYSNEKAKARLGWAPQVPVSEGLSRYLQSGRDGCRA
ncbi:MAG TPA: NAD(P)-dependent oxidoreductase [Candidatus Methylomirabilis sp.]|nr:NAD(P)-dependent oxidoreductase [Candidatus Methylomirabilis sp.]